MLNTLVIVLLICTVITILFSIIVVMLCMLDTIKLSRHINAIDSSVKQEAEQIERAKNLYPPGYLPGIDPKPEPPKIRERDMW